MKSGASHVTLEVRDARTMSTVKGWCLAMCWNTICKQDRRIHEVTTQRQI